MITLKRYLLTLVALLAMTTGAWAQGTDPEPGTMVPNDDNTSATMTMPAYDATVSYELVRDLTVQTQFVGIPTETVFVKKDGDKYVFASGTAPTVALLDMLNQNTPILDGAYHYFEKKNAETGEFEASTVNLLTDAQPGTWRIVTSATDGGPYDGTVRSDAFTLAEAYDLTLSPATDAHLQSVTVAGTAKTADENGVIRGIEPTKKVKITTTGPDYIIRKAAVKKGGASGPATAQFNVPDEWSDGSQTSTYLSASDLEGFQAITLEQAQNIPCPDPSGEVWLIYGFDGNKVKTVTFYNGAEFGGFAESFSHYDIHFQATNSGVKFYYTTGK
ncbi:MAG: hypothetical protein IKS44_04210 [Bacteroidales bacterium]|nr:hypothetical protein [Bacteroidales bacterium]